MVDKTKPETPSQPAGSAGKKVAARGRILLIGALFYLVLIIMALLVIILMFSRG